MNNTIPKLLFQSYVRTIWFFERKKATFEVHLDGDFHYEFCKFLMKKKPIKMIKKLA